jgi:hypothetical protein
MEPNPLGSGCFDPDLDPNDKKKFNKRKICFVCHKKIGQNGTVIKLKRV